MLKKSDYTKRKEIYIPIEIKAREFASQTFLAGELAKRDARVFLGSKSSIDRLMNEKSNNAGAYLYKGGGSSIKKFRDLAPKVSSIAVLDQEVTPALKSYEMIKNRFTKGSLNYVSRLYYIGLEAKKAATRLLSGIDAKNIKDVGWPRVDLWMPSMHHIWRNDVKKIQEEFGDNFILFSSDFGVNSQRLLDERALRFGLVGAEKTKEEVKINKERLEASYKSFLRFIDFLHEIDSNPRLPLIIVRPHPGEDHQIWAEKTSDLKKVKVKYEGDITKWLLASRGVLHRGCSTALQATISNIKTGCLEEYVDSTNNSMVLKLSPMLNGAEEIAAWNETDQNRFDFESTKDILSDHITFSERSATEIIAEDLINLAGEETTPSCLQKKSSIKTLLIRLLNKFRNIKHKKNKKNKKNPHSLGKLPKHNKMQDGIKELEVINLLGSMYQKEQFIIERIIDDLYMIEKIN